MKYFIFSLLLFSCTAEKKLNRIYLNKPTLVAEKTRQWFPCISLRKDTTEIIKDSLIYLDCPQPSNGTKKDYEENTIVKIPYALPVKYVYIKEKIEDSAKIFVKDRIIENKDYKLDKAQIKIQYKNNFNWALICICLTSIFINILQFKKSKNVNSRKKP